MKRITTISIFVVFIAIIALSLSCSHRDKLLNIKINPEDGKFMRIYELDIQKNLIRFQGDSSGNLLQVNLLKDENDISFIEMNKGVRSINTLPLLPNRSYIISVLLQANFSRPAEVNMGIQTIDGGGKQVMWHLNGIPNKTDGWQRWQWEFTTDQRAVHGHFIANLFEFPKDGILKIADIAFIELSEKPLKPYAKGEGVTFRGGPGKLPMRIEDVKTNDQNIKVKVTGALYTFSTLGDSITASQLLEKERDVSVWKSSLSLKGLKVLIHNNKECVLANDQVTIGIQCDGLIMISPQNELMLTCKSKIGGEWNRLSAGNVLVLDEWGGYAVNPDIPLGSGRKARIFAGTDVQPGRVVPGGIDFTDMVDNLTFISKAKPGWKLSWYISPGERIAISVFPPKPFPWKESFNTHFTYLERSQIAKPVDFKKWKENTDIVLLWDFIQRTWAFSYGREHVAHNDKEIFDNVAAIKSAGMRAIIYTSPYYYYSRDAAEFAGEAKRLKEKYSLDGIYFDGIPSQEWIVAYEEMRITREIFPDGVIVLHNTGHPYNGIPPLGDPSIKIPAIECYADATFGGELLVGEGKDWVYPKYIGSPYRVSNGIGSLTTWTEPWHGLTLLQMDLVMILHNGRSQDKSHYKAYIERLEKLWDKKGNDPEFYEKYYLPEVKKMTKGLLPE